MTVTIDSGTTPKDTAVGNAVATHKEAYLDHYQPLTPEGLLVFCQSQLRTLDEKIQKKMNGQQDLVVLEGDVGNVEAELKSLMDGPGHDGDVAFDDAEAMSKVDRLIDTAIAHAKEAGNGDLVKNLQNVKDILHATGDTIVSKDEIKNMCNVLDSATATCRSGAELSMIELQSLISKRATQLQLTTGMMNSLDEGSKSIAGNIGR